MHFSPGCHKIHIDKARFTWIWKETAKTRSTYYFTNILSIILFFLYKSYPVVFLTWNNYLFSWLTWKDEVSLEFCDILHSLILLIVWIFVQLDFWHFLHSAFFFEDDFQRKSKIIHPVLSQSFQRNQQGGKVHAHCRMKILLIKF